MDCRRHETRLESGFPAGFTLKRCNHFARVSIRARTQAEGRYSYSLVCFMVSSTSTSTSTIENFYSRLFRAL